MRPVAMLVGVGGIVLVSAVVFGWGQAQRSAVSHPDPIATVEEPVAPTSRERVGRQVAPDIAAPQLDVTDLERVDPRDPLTPLGAPEDPATRPPREMLLHRPVAIAAGRVEAAGYRVSLEGIEIVAPSEMCDKGGRSWPCGLHARTAFRNYLRGRAIACAVPGMPGDDPIVSRCKVGTADPAAWLVAQGWARAIQGGPYEEQQSEAMEKGRGVYAAAPVAN